MRKLFLSLVAIAASVGLTLAAPVTFVKMDEAKKEITVKDKEGVESTYTISDESKFWYGDKELEVAKVMKRLANAKSGKTKFEIEVTDKKTIKEIKFPAPKPKN